MQELDDIRLLREYAEAGSEVAFASLVERHVDRVFSVAVRLTGNIHQAEEITQAVFVILARKAGSLRRGVILEGWLYQAARLTAVTYVRSEIRRAHREKAFMQTTSNENESDAWSQIAPLLDGALADLSERDRNAVVLRFFYGKSLHEIGVALGASDDSARMRVNRALEKLRQYFFKQGVTSTTAIIAAAMSANSVQAAPVTLAKIATAAVFVKGAAGSTSTLTMVKGVLKVMTWTKMQTTIAGAVIVALAAYSVMEQQVGVRLRAQNEALRKQMTDLQEANAQLTESSRRRVPRLLAPPVANTVAAPAEDLPKTNLYERFLTNAPRLTPQQVDAFLQANGRKAASLLAGYRTSRDVGLLREAMEKYPNDPMVAFETQTALELSADEKRPWLATFEKDAPNNALANYLSASDAFNSGQPDRALQELAGAAGKQFDDYSVSRLQDNTEAYLSAGYSAAEADSISSVLMMQVDSLKKLGMHLVDLASTYNQAGDPASAQTVLQMAVSLGQSMRNAPSSGPVLVSQLLGMSIETKALSAMDPNNVFGNSGQTVQQMLDQIAQNRSAIRDLKTQADSLMPKLTDEDMIVYTSRVQLFGAVPAMRWVVNKYGQQL